MCIHFVLNTRCYTAHVPEIGCYMETIYRKLFKNDKFFD